IECRVCSAFGKDSGPTERHGRVLLASQVVEQSLDLDFDVLISDLAPIDLLIQRAGRVHRHLRDGRGNRVMSSKDVSRESPVLHVHIPPEPETPTATWFSDYFPRVKKVYPNPGELWKTKVILRKEGQIGLPDRARVLIEAVYGDGQLASPEVFSEAEGDSQGGEAAARDQADFNTITFERGYELGATWDSEERIRTRLGDEQRTVYLARFEEGRLRPYYQGEQGEYGWDLSAIKVRTSSMMGEVEYPAQQQEAIDAMRAERWIESDALFLIVEDDRLEWDLVGDSSHDCYGIRYDTAFGLRRAND
ncbi:MAG: CRISPR-associated helicase/endonuclease Cas3, partial [bacterium]